MNIEREFRIVGKVICYLWAGHILYSDIVTHDKLVAHAEKNSYINYS